MQSTVRMVYFDPLLIKQYDFPIAGEDGIPWHNHKAEPSHLTVCLKGRVRIFGRGWEHILTAGTWCDLSGERNEHEIVALENDSRVLNIHKGANPYDPEDLKFESVKINKALLGKVPPRENQKAHED